MLNTPLSDSDKLGIINSLDIVSDIQTKKSLERFIKYSESDLEWMKGTSIVFLSSGDSEKYKSNEKDNIRLIEKKLEKNPNAKIIIVGISELLDYEKEYPIIKILLNKKNVVFLYFMDLVGDISKSGDLFLEKNLKGYDKSLQDNLLLKDALSEIVSRQFSGFFHGKQGFDTIDSKVNYLLSKEVNDDSRFLETIDTIKKSFYLQDEKYKNLSDKEMLSVIVDFYKSGNDKINTGKEFDGVYVDWDGTLYDEETKGFSKKVLDLIEKYAKEGKEITIWTLGLDLEKKQKMLDDAGLPYKVKSKLDFKGGTVEVAIDDQDQDVFYNNTGVKVKNFIQI